jgi:Zn-finger nucleic acid-binding protein
MMILACPTCDSRYDVSGYPVGQQFRCRCGTVTTLHAPPRQAAMLACPHCGGDVDASATRCAYCNVELLAKGCPRCLTRGFAGYKHCPACGAELDLATVGDARRDLPCPRCEQPLRARLVGDVVVDECGACLGLFLDPVAIKRVIEDRQQARAEALLGAVPTQAVRAARPGERMYVKCPSCRVVMNRRLFAAGTGVVVDVCRAHGTFFDGGELPVVIDFVMKGGLEKAMRKELEQERLRLDRERNALRQMSHWAPQTSYSTTSSAFIDLLSALILR